MSRPHLARPVADRARGTECGALGTAHRPGLQTVLATADRDRSGALLDGVLLDSGLPVQHTAAGAVGRAAGEGRGL